MRWPDVVVLAAPTANAGFPHLQLYNWSRPVFSADSKLPPTFFDRQARGVADEA